MPVTKSAKKALRRDKRRRIVNLPYKKELKAALKRVRERSTNKNLSDAYSAIDRAAKKKVIHQNKASRLKSHLLKASLKLKKSSPTSSKRK